MRRLLLFLFFVTLLCVSSLGECETIFEKIEGARQAGRIDRATELLYKLYAVKSPDRLPDEYAREGAAFCATVPMLEVWRNLDLLVRAKGGKVNVLLDRPTGLDSIINTLHFKFHWTSVGTDSVPRWYVESLAVYAESSWTYEVSYLGWEAPPADGDSGGDTLYDVYVFDIPISGVLGYVQTELMGPDPLQEDATSWMAFDYDVSPSFRRSTMAHEFNHACQFSYSYAEGDFWYENTAVWAQDEVYDGENDYTSYLGGGVDNPLTRPEWSLDYFGGFYPYGGVSWTKYLAERNGNLLLRRVWALNAINWGDHTMDDIDSTLAEYYSDSLTTALREYGVWRYFTGATRAQSPYYEEGLSWTSSYIAPEHVHSTYPASGDQGARPPDYYGINFIEFDTTGLPGGLDISFDGQDGYYWAASIIEYNDGGPSTFSQIDLDSNGSGSKVVAWDSSMTLVLVPSVLSSTGTNLSYTYSADFIPTDTDTPTVQVVYPNGGENLSMGSTDSITWIATDNVIVDSVTIYYSTDGGGAWLPVANGEPNDSIYAWSVPGTPSSNCLVRITAWDWTEKWDEDTSDAVFTIGDFTGPSVTVLYPNGGENLGIGSTDTVRWNAYDNVAVDSIEIDYSTDGGGSWASISTGEPNDGGFPWLIPNTPSDSCLVRVIAFDPSWLQGADTSDNFFTIGDDVNPLVSVSYPNGGESFIPGTTDTIRWMAWDANGIDSINIYYTVDDGLVWIDVSHGELNDSEYEWVVPDTPSDSCRVRVDAFDPAGNSGSDNSNGLFSIIDNQPPDVDVVSPNGGEQWEIGGVQQITWVAYDNKRVDSVSISYSYDSASTWFAVSDGEPDDSSYDWTIPGPPSDSCLVRIVAFDFAGQTGVDTSDALFIITDTTLPSVSVIYPDGGEVLQAGAVDTIRWAAYDNDVIDSVSVFYSSDSGAAWQTLSTGEPNDSLYEWSIPAVVSDSCLVRVLAFDARGNTSYDESESLFSITDGIEPSVQVLAPNGGEVWNSGDEDTIRWVASDLFGVDSLDIYYSTDGGATWIPVAEGELNDSSYAWNVPATPSDSCLLRIRAFDPSENLGIDVSDSLFSIRMVGVSERVCGRKRPRRLALSFAAPNPFKTRAVLEVALPESGPVRLDVFGVTGRMVDRIFVGQLESGYHLFQWDASKEAAEKPSGGVYFFRLESPGGVRVTKGILLE